MFCFKLKSSITVKVVALIFVSGLAGSTAGIAQDEKIDATKIVDFFSREKDGLLTRGLCVGTADDCKPVKKSKELDMYVAFELDSAKLTAASIANLEQFAIALGDDNLSGLDFQVAGHTDARGKPEYNLDLSSRRALAVKSKLQELGVDGDRLKAVGFGEEKPRSADPMDAQNRRVEISLN